MSERYWASAVVRLSKRPELNKDSFIGTAFFVSPTRLLTCKHVVQKADESKGEAVYVHGAAADGQPKIDWNNVQIHETRDAALLTLYQPSVVKHAIRTCDDTVGIGDDITLTGYTDCSGQLHVCPRKISSHEPLVDDYIADIFISTGMSGGPALKNGRLVGLVQARDKDKNVTYVVPLRSFRDLIPDLLIAREILQRAVDDMAEGLAQDKHVRWAFLLARLEMDDRLSVESSISNEQLAAAFICDLSSYEASRLAAYAHQWILEPNRKLGRRDQARLGQLIKEEPELQGASRLKIAERVKDFALEFLSQRMYGRYCSVCSGQDDGPIVMDTQEVAVVELVSAPADNREPSYFSPEDANQQDLISCFQVPRTAPGGIVAGTEFGAEKIANHLFDALNPAKKVRLETNMPQEEKEKLWAQLSILLKNKAETVREERGRYFLVFRGEKVFTECAEQLKVLAKRLPLLRVFVLPDQIPIGDESFLPLSGMLYRHYQYEEKSNVSVAAETSEPVASPSKE